MLAFDTSSIIHAWDHYPLKQFPQLWEWLGVEFNAGHFVMSQVADGETKQRDVDCHNWLHANDIKLLPVTEHILICANEMKHRIGIVDDKYQPGGVGENDLLIIATCMEHMIYLVSNENRQNLLPHNPAKYKIPAVCAMASVNVECLNFRELLVRSGRTFG